MHCGGLTPMIWTGREKAATSPPPSAFPLSPNHDLFLWLHLSSNLTFSGTDIGHWVTYPGGLSNTLHHPLFRHQLGTPFRRPWPVTKLTFLPLVANRRPFQRSQLAPIANSNSQNHLGDFVSWCLAFKTCSCACGQCNRPWCR